MDTFVNIQCLPTMTLPSIFGGSLPKAGKQPIFLSFRASTVFIVAVCCVAAFTDIFLYSLVSHIPQHIDSHELIKNFQVVPVIPFALSSRAGVKQEEGDWLAGKVRNIAG